MVAFVDAQSVRDYLVLNTDSTSRYTDATINSNIRTAAEFIERACGRYFGDRTMTYLATTEGAAAVPLPGLRTATSISRSGSTLVADQDYYLIPDAMQTGVYTAIQFRAFTPRADGAVYLHSTDWFDRGLDLPGPYGVGAGSLPNDLSVAGSFGYTEALFPEAARHANKVLAAYFTKRPDALLSGAITTPDGQSFDLSSFPPEFARFVDLWKVSGRRVISVG